jgi:molybdopterin-guanine dinucleotide biosynthesis protein A
MKATGIILSGGKSTRMGQNKAFIEIEGIPIIHRIHALFRELFEEVIIVTNEKDLFRDLDARIVRDLLPGAGALGGLYTGLFYSSFCYSFCAACDMPFLKGALIEYLYTRTLGYDVVVPKTREGLEPLHAYYSRYCMEPARETLANGSYRIFDFYPLVKVNTVDEDEIRGLDPEGESFLNVNTPEELLSLHRRRTGFRQ